MTQYAYNSSIHSIIDVNFLYVIYDYNFEIKLNIENEFFRKKCRLFNKKKNYINLEKRCQITNEIL